VPSVLFSLSASLALICFFNHLGIPCHVFFMKYIVAMVAITAEGDIEMPDFSDELCIVTSLLDHTAVSIHVLLLVMTTEAVHEQGEKNVTLACYVEIT